MSDPSDVRRAAPTDLDVRLELLIDGELDDQARRELFCQLDAERDGWKRCALALLDEQCLRRELRAMVDECDAAGAADPLPQSRAVWGARRRRFVVLKQTTAVAATMIVAFVLGWLAAQPHGSNQIGPATAANNPSASSPARRAPSAGNGGTSVPPTGASEWQAAHAAEAARWEVVTVSLPIEAEGSLQTTTLPVRAVTADESDWFSEAPALLPDELVLALQQAGHQVEQRTRLVSIALEDGRSLIVPIDDWEVRLAKSTGDTPRDTP